MKANEALQKKASATAQRKPGEAKTIKDWIQIMQPEIAKALPSVITPERFTRICMTALSSNPMLQSCTATSFVAAMMNAAQLGVEPNTPLGQAYLIPFKNRKKGVVECQFQLGYKGMLDLAYRTEMYQIITAQTVYEGDKFEFEYGLDPKLVHVPTMTGRGKPIAYYAMYKLINGGNGFVVASAEDIEQHAKKYSKTFGSGPWQSDFDAMAKKTALKQLLKYAPMKTDMARAMSTDESVKNEISDDMTTVENEDYIDITPDGTTVNKETGEVLMDGMTNAEADAMLADQE